MAEHQAFDTAADRGEPPVGTHRGSVPMPAGVIILGLLHLLGGVLLIYTQIHGIPVWRAEDLKAVLARVDTSLTGFIFSMLVLSVVAVGSGLGMLMGRRWGWWLAAFYYVHSILRNGWGLVIIWWMGDELATTRGMNYYLLKHGSRIAVGLIILFWLFKPHIREFFRAERLRASIAIGALLGACATIGLVTLVLNTFAP